MILCYVLFPSIGSPTVALWYLYNKTIEQFMTEFVNVRLLWRVLRTGYATLLFSAKRRCTSVWCVNIDVFFSVNLVTFLGFSFQHWRYPHLMTSPVYIRTCYSIQEDKHFCWTFPSWTFTTPCFQYNRNFRTQAPSLQRAEVLESESPAAFPFSTAWYAKCRITSNTVPWDMVFANLGGLNYTPVVQCNGPCGSRLLLRPR